VAAGRRESGPVGNTVFDLILARYHPDGSLDASFGSGGTVRTRFRSSLGLEALVLQADGWWLRATRTLLAQV